MVTVVTWDVTAEVDGATEGVVYDAVDILVVEDDEQSTAPVDFSLRVPEPLLASVASSRWLVLVSFNMPLWPRPLVGP